jgi:hypothetical protein
MTKTEEVGDGLGLGACPAELAEGVFVPVGVAVCNITSVGEAVGVLVALPVATWVAVGVSVAVLVDVGAWVGVGVSVGVEVEI